MKRVRSILVPTDFSDAADAAWEQAKWLAARFNAHVHLLHVVSAPMVFDAWGTEGAVLRMAAVMEDAERFARERLKALVPARGALAGRVRTTTESGPTVDAILAYADVHRIDLIVMGTHGRGTVGHLLLGSVAERCVRRAKVPVLTVHGREKTARPSNQRRVRERAPRTRTAARLAAPPPAVDVGIHVEK